MDFTSIEWHSVEFCGLRGQPIKRYKGTLTLTFSFSFAALFPYSITSNGMHFSPPIAFVNQSKHMGEPKSILELVME